MAQPYIAIAGPIGAGKSTLARAIADQTGWKLYLESAGERNAFLADYYEQPERFIFPSQTFFYLEAAKQGREISTFSGGAVQDRSLWEHYGVFTAEHKRAGTLSAREFQLLDQMYHLLIEDLQPPDLLVVINGDGSELVERVTARGRDYEQGLDERYLHRMSEHYRDWAERWQMSKVLSLPLATDSHQTQQAVEQILTLQSA